MEDKMDMGVFLFLVIGTLVFGFTIPYLERGINSALRYYRQFRGRL